MTFTTLLNPAGALTPAAQTHQGRRLLRRWHDPEWVPGSQIIIGDQWTRDESYGWFDVIDKTGPDSNGSFWIHLGNWRRGPVEVVAGNVARVRAPIRRVGAS